MAGDLLKLIADDPELDAQPVLPARQLRTPVHRRDIIGFTRVFRNLVVSCRLARPEHDICNDLADTSKAPSALLAMIIFNRETQRACDQHTVKAS